ncbi:hypothetical protein PPACK8108_LOCUS6846 [Phakopsora pachyrhizi]|uniref:Uncharacterized protein n=1 Tax=Phakopsora pachyrhizi TaxID=170000 RepID=A0AAV0ARQ6_PHAPC|nr:hypothetical protein PPACK8108_LOCUS6846 [Phakopsora pachyrhizi]
MEGEEGGEEKGKGQGQGGQGARDPDDYVNVAIPVLPGKQGEGRGRAGRWPWAIA